MRLVFIDTETNDHPSKGSALRIVSITWLIARLDGTVEKIEDYIIRPDGFRIAYGAEQVHKISEAHAHKHGQPIGDVLTMLVDDLQHPQGMTMICHNVRFDRDVIGYELQRHGIPFDIYSLPSFDTMKSTASICQLPKARGSGYKDPKLQELHAHLFGKEFENAHTSKADVEATARCFFELRRRGLFGEIGRSVANQQVEQSRQQLAANTNKDVAKKMQPLCDADVKVTKTPPAHVEPAKQQTVAVVKPMARAEPARKVAIPQSVVAPPAKQPAETMVKPTPNATGSTPATANKMRGWIYLVTNQAMPGHVLVDYCETDPIQQANKLNGPGAPFPYIVAYAALMTDPRGGVGLFTVKYSDKKQSGKWYSFAPSEAAAAIRELCEKQILYEDVQVEIEKVDSPKVDDAVTWYNLGVSYNKPGQSGLAIEAYKRAVQINPQLVQAWNNLGFNYGKAGQTAQAIEAFQQVVRTNPQDADAWYNLGSNYEEAGNIVQAMEAYHQASRLKTQSEQAASKKDEPSSDDQGYVKSQFVTIDLIGLLRKAAEAGQADAQCKLGEMYDLGRDFAHNMGLALHWYKKAAEQGNSDAQYWLGCLYAGSKCGMHNPDDAAQWMALAAKQGHSRAIEWQAKTAKLLADKRIQDSIASLVIEYCPFCGSMNRIAPGKPYPCKHCNKEVPPVRSAPIELKQNKLTSQIQTSSTKLVAAHSKRERPALYANIRKNWVISSDGVLLNLSTGISYCRHDYKYAVNLRNSADNGYEITCGGPDVWVSEADVTTVDIKQKIQPTVTSGNPDAQINSRRIDAVGGKVAPAELADTWLGDWVNTEGISEQPPAPCPA